MYTSYFGNLRNVANPLSIAGKCPKWYTGPEFKILAPKWSFFTDYKQGLIDELEYGRQYKELVLDPLNVISTYSFLTQTYGDDVTLLCYEKPSEFCHRKIVAGWIEFNLGIRIKEIKKT